MGVAFRSANSSLDSNTTTVTVNNAPGVAANDLLLVFLLELANFSSATYTPPAGFTAGPTIAAGGAAGGSLAVFYKTATATEPSTYTFTASVSAVFFSAVLAYEYGLVDAAALAANATAALGVTAASVTTVDSDETVVVYYACPTSTDDTFGFGNDAITDRTGGSYLPGAAYHQLAGDYTGPATPGTTSPGSSVSATNTYYIAATVAVKSAPLAPAAPTLVAPPNASYQDPATSFPFSATFNSLDGTSQDAYAMRFKVSGGSYSYWNAATNAMQSTIVWNTDSAEPGTTFSVALPASVMSDGSVYNWSFASQSASYGDNLQGPFATDFTFTAQQGPSVSVSAPSGIVVGTSQPIVVGLPSVAPGAPQPAYQINVESGGFGTVPGSGTQQWNSAVVQSGSTSVTVGTPLASSATYRAFVQITETGGQTSNWGYSTFTLRSDTPAVPIVTATPSADPVTGCPMIALTVQGLDNYLSAVDSSFETGMGTWTGDSATLAQSSAEALNGAHSLALTSTSTLMGAQSNSGVPALPGDIFVALASSYPAATARSFTVNLVFRSSAGASVETVTGATATEVLGTWTGGSVSGTAPANTASVDVQVAYPTVVSGEVHYVDCAGVFPSQATVWALGGFAGTVGAQITRTQGSFVSGTPTMFPLGAPRELAESGNLVSDGTAFYVRGASPANPLPIPAIGQLALLSDYEVSPSTDYTYSAVDAVPTPPLTSQPSLPTLAVAVVSTNWWELDPTDPSTATNAQPTQWNPQNTEQSTAHMVMGQVVMNMVANTMLNQDFNATWELFDPGVYTAFQALLNSQKTLFISSPWGPHDSGYYRLGPQSGGLSSGVGNKTKSAQLLASTTSGPHRTIDTTAVAQARPSV